MDMRAAAAVLFLALAASGASAEPSIVGAWFGKGQPYDKNQLWLERYMPGGRFSILTRICSKNGSRDYLEVGTWSYKNGVQEIVTTSAGGKLVHYVERYVSLANDGRTRKYRFTFSDRMSSEVGYVYSADRVPDDFDLPACGPQIS